jgi:hypothetical protein
MEPDELDRLVRWIRETHRPETEGHLSLPGQVTDRPAFGPNIPVLGAYGTEVRASGLVVARSLDRKPPDLFGAFATAEDVLGGARPIAELAEALRECEFEDVLHRLVTLNAFLTDKNIKDVDLNRELVAALLPQNVAVTLRPLIESGERAFTSSHVVLTLMKLAVIHANGAQQVPLEYIGLLLLGMADHIGGHIRADDDSWPLELTRYGWFQSRDPQSVLWGRFQRLWREVIPSLRGDPRFVDPGEVIEAELGIGYETFLALGIGMSARFDQMLGKGPMWFPTNIEGTAASPDDIARYVDTISADRAWYIDATEGEEDPTFSWNFTRMRQRPLLRQGDRMIPFSLAMLREKVTDGLFYTVADLMAERGRADSQRWREFFGLVWESYVRRLIEVGVGDRARMIPESRMMAAWPEQQICDNVIEYPNRYLLVEAVARRFTEATVAKGDLSDLEEDLRKAALIKSRQLCSTVRLLMDRSDALEAELGRRLQPTDASRFSPVIVLPGPFPLMPVLTDRVSLYLRDDPRCAELGLPPVDDVAILAAADFEYLVGTAAHTGRTLVDLLDDWRRSEVRELRDSNWRTWAAESIPGGAYMPDWLMEGGREGIMWGARQLFRADELPPGRADKEAT